MQEIYHLEEKNSISLIGKKGAFLFKKTHYTANAKISRRTNYCKQSRSLF